MKTQLNHPLKSSYSNIYFNQNRVNLQVEQTVKDIDGNLYHTVTIGSQVWMVENLKVTHYRNGDPIPNVADDIIWRNLTTGACSDYNNIPENSSAYGKLYNCHAVVDSRNLCPTGWHVPTDTEWTTLINFLGGKAVAGGKLKKADTTLWLGNNSGTGNESGFSAILGGIRGSYGPFEDINELGFWWSSTETDNNSAFFWYMDYYISSVYRNLADKIFGLSVRCIRDY